MIPLERKRWLAARLRQIAREPAHAHEWPAVAADFEKLADDLEQDAPLSGGGDKLPAEKLPR